MILAVTGHRPPKLGGYTIEAGERLYRFATRKLAELDPESVITGMALGFDTAVARACLYLNIPYVAAIPFIGQESQWPLSSQATYEFLLKNAASVEIVTDGGYTAEAMQLRNEWMVDNGTDVGALWNGTAGGTGNCVKYAEKHHKPVLNFWDEWLEFISSHTPKTS